MTSNEFILSSITKPDYFFKIVKHNGEAFVSTALLKQAIKDTPQPFVLVPFYRGAVVFEGKRLRYTPNSTVLVPFYRGAVVFIFRCCIVFAVI